MTQRSSGSLFSGAVCLLATVILGFLLAHNRLSMEPVSPRPGEVNSSPSTTSESRPSDVSAQFDVASLTQLEATLTPAQRQRGSWENPFVPVLWQAPGWNFDESAMRPLAGPSRADGNHRPTAATFRRPYSQFVMTVTIESNEPAELSERLLSVELLTRASDSKVVIDVSNERIDIRVDAPGATVQLGSSEWNRDQGETPTHSNDQPGNSINLTIGLTPSRLLIRREGRLAANKQRPASLAGTDCFVRFAAGAHLTGVSNLRFEGD